MTQPAVVAMKSFRPSSLRSIATLLLCGQAVAWVPSAVSRGRVRHHSMASQDIVDVDFERVEEEKEAATETKMDTPVAAEPETLFDLSLDADPDWKEMRIPFIDGENYIDGKLAFMATLDGAQYGIAIPFEHAAAITLEKADGSVEYMSPDSDDNQEIMEVMAAQLQEHVGDELKLKRTPRVLTISGPLDELTKNWESELLPDPVDKKALLDESDEGEDFFTEFMKKELGEEEYEKTMRGEDTVDVSDELMKMFSIPGLGDSEDDMAGLEAMFESLDTPEEDFAELQKKGQDLNHQGVALKLVSYVLPDNKSYSLVQLLQPYALIGKYVDEEDGVRFELLTKAEAKIVVPRLEEVCKADLLDAGLQL